MYAHMEEAGKARSVKLEKMRGEICRIRPHFQGRERYFYIRAVHRHYGYRPFDALLRSSDLIVQILVFMTIYRYLLESDDLLGQSFLGIADLSRPDALLGGVHLLPFVMTAVNIFAIISYEQTPTKRTQGFVLTGIFLLLLYPSPSGLVVYWTANNLISWSKSALVPALFARLPVKFREDVRRWALQE
jgi:membrane protein insertase Oxa1/YidC/SpoIIIJ